MSRAPENPLHPQDPEPVWAQKFSRRRFLVGLGALAVGGAVAPLVGRMGRMAAGTLAAGPPRVERSRPGLGTWIRVVAVHPQESVAERAIDRAFAAIDRVDSQMSIHRAGSELARSATDSCG